VCKAAVRPRMEFREETLALRLEMRKRLALRPRVCISLLSNAKVGPSEHHREERLSE